MYRLNPLHRNVLIVTDEVIAKAPVQQDQEVRNLAAAIEIAEERFIVPLLGDKFYEDFINMKNMIVTSGNIATLQTHFSGATLTVGDIVNAIELVTNTWYVNLWKRFLWKICAECVAYVAIPTNAVRSTAQGEMQHNPAGSLSSAGSASAHLGFVKFKLDRILQERIDPLLRAMNTWMCTNKANFLLWDSSHCNSLCAPANLKATGYVHGIYDDPDDCDCSISAFD